MKNLEKLIYIDDSGNSERGLAVYGWVEFAPHKWADVLGAWLSHRKNLVGKYGVPVTQELHMTQYALGRGRVSTNPPSAFIDNDGSVLWKDLGGKVAEESLECIRCIEGLTVGAVYRYDAKTEWHKTRAGLYSDLLDHFETQLKQRNALGMIFMDGNGTDRIYTDAHRHLPRTQRHIIEDPIFMDSRSSQLMQMADHVAWCANSAITRVPKHKFAHNWYETYLSERDPRLYNS